MGLPLEFLMRIDKATTPTQKGAENMFIIVQRPYAYLRKELSTAFQGKEDARVIVNRRVSERRKNQRPVSLEKRQADRRRPKDGLLEVVLLA